MAPDYRTLPADQLLAALELAGRIPDLDLIHACLERRNEPCPCGSGRKYKHCCGKRR